MTSSFGQVIGTARDKLPDISDTNYDRTAPDLTEAVNTQIDRNILDTKQFFADMMEIEKVRAETPMNNLRDLAGFSEQALKAKQIFDANEETRELIREGNLGLQTANRQADFLKEDEYQFNESVFINEVGEDAKKGSVVAKDFFRVLNNADPQDLTVKEFFKKAEKGGFLGARKEVMLKSGWDNIETTQEALSLHDSADELAILSLIVRARQAGIDTTSPAFRRYFRRNFYPMMAARRENNLASWEQRRDRLDASRRDTKLGEDIINTIKSYSPPVTVDGQVVDPGFSPNIDGEGGLVDRIMLQKNFGSRQEGYRYLTQSIAAEIESGSENLTPSDGRNFTDAFLFKSRTTGSTVPDTAFSQLNIGSRGAFTTDMLNRLSRAYTTYERDPNADIAAATAQFERENIAPLREQYPLGLPEGILLDEMKKWRAHPILKNQPFPQYFQSNLTRAEVGTKFDNSSYSSRVGQSNSALTNYKDQLTNDLVLYLQQNKDPNITRNKLGVYQFELDKAIGDLDDRAQKALVAGDVNMTYQQALAENLDPVMKKLIAGGYVDTPPEFKTTSVDIVDMVEKVNSNNSVLDAEQLLSLHEKPMLAKARQYVAGDIPLPNEWNMLANMLGEDVEALMKRRLIATGGYDPKTKRLTSRLYELDQFQREQLLRNPNATKSLNFIYGDNGNKAAVVYDAARSKYIDKNGNEQYVEDGYFQMGRRGLNRSDRNNGDKLTGLQIETLAKRGGSNFGRYNLSAGQIKEAFATGLIDKSANFDENMQTQILTVLWEKRANQQNSIRGLAFDGEVFWGMNDLTFAEREAAKEFFPALKDVDLFGNFGLLSKDLNAIIFDPKKNKQIFKQPQIRGRTRNRN